MGKSNGAETCALQIMKKEWEVQFADGRKFKNLTKAAEAMGWKVSKLRGRLERGNYPFTEFYTANDVRQIETIDGNKFYTLRECAQAYGLTYNQLTKRFYQNKWPFTHKKMGYSSKFGKKCVWRGKIFPTMAEAAKYLGVSQTTISRWQHKLDDLPIGGTVRSKNKK